MSRSKGLGIQLSAQHTMCDALDSIQGTVEATKDQKF